MASNDVVVSVDEAHRSGRPHKFTGYTPAGGGFWRVYRQIVNSYAVVLKSSNIILDVGGNAKASDFGLDTKCIARYKLLWS